MKGIEAYAVVRTALNTLKNGGKLDIEKLEEALDVIKAMLSRYIKVRTSIMKHERINRGKNNREDD